MGGADYTEHAPPQSYINVLDYESPKDLADYLIHLANNREEYEAYFWWKVVNKNGNCKIKNFLAETLQSSQ